MRLGLSRPGESSRPTGTAAAGGKPRPPPRRRRRRAPSRPARPRRLTPPCLARPVPGATGTGPSTKEFPAIKPGAAGKAGASAAGAGGSGGRDGQVVGGLAGAWQRSSPPQRKLVAGAAVLMVAAAVAIAVVSFLPGPQPGGGSHSSAATGTEAAGGGAPAGQPSPAPAPSGSHHKARHHKPARHHHPAKTADGLTVAFADAEEAAPSSAPRAPRRRPADRLGQRQRPAARRPGRPRQLRGHQHRQRPDRPPDRLDHPACRGRPRARLGAQRKHGWLGLPFRRSFGDLPARPGPEGQPGGRLILDRGPQRDGLRPGGDVHHGRRYGQDPGSVERADPVQQHQLQRAPPDSGPDRRAAAHRPPGPPGRRLAAVV